MILPGKFVVILMVHKAFLQITHDEVEITSSMQNTCSGF